MIKAASQTAPYCIYRALLLIRALWALVKSSALYSENCAIQDIDQICRIPVVVCQVRGLGCGTLLPVQTAICLESACTIHPDTQALSVAVFRHSLCTQKHVSIWPMRIMSLVSLCQGPPSTYPFFLCLSESMRLRRGREEGREGGWAFGLSVKCSCCCVTVQLRDRQPWSCSAAGTSCF